MARPKQDGSPAADARIEAAFFELLKEKPFDKITVSALVHEAGVNRNSFYYHFADLDDLARSAVANLLVPEIPRLLASGFTPASEEVDEVFAKAVASTGALGRLAAVTGAHSTAALRGMLKSAFLDLWLEVFELTPDGLDRRTAATVDFALGGMLELVSALPPRADLVAELDEIRRLPVVQAVSRTVVSALAEASRRAAAERRGGAAGRR